MLKHITNLVLFLALSLSVTAQEKNLLGWDLSYGTVLKQNNPADTDWVRMWLAQSESPAEKWIATWQNAPIISSILIEHPAFHAAERTTMWFVRTNDGAYYWELVQASKPRRNEEEIKPEVYDALFSTITAWKQLNARPASETPKDILPGYIGFLSIFNQNGSRQIMLTMEDFVLCLDASCMPGKLTSGRLMAALEPIIIPEDEKKYRHKSETEIVRMTPEQRIDEVIKEEGHRTVNHEKYRLLLQRYRRKDGLKGWTRLIELIDGYNPKRTRDTRFYSAMRIAEDIDERVIRLRSSTEGKRIIEAVERLSGRRRAKGNSDEGIDWVLESTKGINEKDRDVRDTLWVKYRIKMSDSELLDFSNYLVEQNPTYPSWSERKLITDRSRKNEWGHPLRVFIMTKPARYLQSYRAFKKHLQGK